MSPAIKALPIFWTPRNGGHWMLLGGEDLETAPKFCIDENGKSFWTYQGMFMPSVGLNAVVGRPLEEYGMEPNSLEEMREGVYNVHARIDDMNTNGVDTTPRSLGGERPLAKGEAPRRITGFRSGSITRISPNGAVLPALDTPGEAITQVRFGGEDMRDIYINAVSIEGGDNLKDGEIPTEKRSFLYRGRSVVRGRPIAPTQFDLN